MDTDKRGAQLKAARQAGVDEAVKRYLDHLTVERGLARHTLEAYRRDLERYAGVLGATAQPYEDYSLFSLYNGVGPDPHIATGRCCADRE